jgi:hypothetical protein
MMLNSYKWYRKLKGGVWYNNRYIFDIGRTVIFIWERTKGGETGGYDSYNVSKEDYRKHTEFTEVLDGIQEQLNELEVIAKKLDDEK